MCFALGTVCWARQEDADRFCLDTHDKIFFKTVPQNLSQTRSYIHTISQVKQVCQNHLEKIITPLWPNYSGLTELCLFPNRWSLSKLNRNFTLYV